MSDEPRPSAAMPTDDERREVARRIRFIPKSGKPVSFFVLARQLGLETDPDFLIGSAYTSESVLRLADLIEPAPERTCRMVHQFVSPLRRYRDFCSKCGWLFRVDDTYRYCPNCGAKVVGE